jgi:hypothetical protein
MPELRPRRLIISGEGGSFAFSSSVQHAIHGKKLSKLNTVLVVSLCTLQDHRRR